MKIRLATKGDCDYIKTNADQIYFKTEKEFWKKNYYRISKKECLNLISKNELYVLANRNEILGFVVIKKINSKIITFSMLTVIEKHHNKGYGNFLIKYIFDKANSERIETVLIEILCAKHWGHPQKEFLTKWYTNLGFSFINNFSFESKYPTHARFMKCELEFKLYAKTIWK